MNSLLPLLFFAATLAASAQVTKPFPAHWGEPPKIQARDMRELPGGYGRGSSTLAKWIEANLAKDGAGGAAQPPASAPLFECDFSKLSAGPLPESFLVIQGDFAVKDLGTNKVLELPGAPVDSFSVLFGPAKAENLAVEARIFGTAKGRRMPTFGVGLGGVAGYKLQVSPGKKVAELLVAETQLVASAPVTWESGAWTECKLQIRKTGAAAWRVEAKVWNADAPEPKEWLLTFDAKELPISGQASILGSPLSGTPIWYDDLRVTGTLGK
jgi:hypothetical protein